MPDRHTDHIPDGTGGAVTGRVTTPDGWPVPEAVLTVTDPAGRQAARVAADGDAAFTAAGLAAGTYTVIATAPGHHPMARTATVTPDRRTDLGTVTLTWAPSR